MLEILLLGFLFFTIIAVVLLISGLITSDAGLIQSRLGTISSARAEKKEDEELSKPFHDRVILPLINRFSQFIMKITPKQITSGYENKINAAGRPFNFRVSDWLIFQILFAVIFPLASIILGISFNTELKKILIMAGAEAFIGIAGPYLILTNEFQKRQAEIIKTLPDMLDLLTVSVEAGLGFDAALSKVVEKMPGVLSKEFERVIQEMKVGRQKKDSLKDMSDRIGVVDFTTFIASVIQADQLGVSIGKVLRIQSNQMRLKRRQRAREKAMKAPVKMLIPMVLFIFPTIFTVVLGPTAIKIINTFKK